MPEEEKSPLTPEEEERWAELEANEEKAEEWQLQHHQPGSPKVNFTDSQQEISAYFEAAIKKLDKVDSDANKKRSEIVQELARDLEGKMPTDEIAAEIVHQLRGRIGERRVYECLEGEQYAKYKKKHRVQNARKRRGRKDQPELAAEPQLKEVAVRASGQEEIIEPTHSSEENLAKTQPTQPEQDADTNSTISSSTMPQPIDTHAVVQESMLQGSMNKPADCENCLAKGIRIKKLEEENRELRTRCSLVESTNNKLTLKLMHQSKYINALLNQDQGKSPKWR